MAKLVGPTINQATRLLRAVRAAGETPRELVVGADGSIRVIFEGDTAKPPTTPTPNVLTASAEFEAWEQKRNARKAQALSGNS